MSDFYLFSHGVTILVVKVLSVGTDGQAHCKVARRLHEPGKKGPAYFRWLHDQPGFGDEIVLPFEMLRPCQYGVKMRRSYTRSEQFAPGKLLWAGLIVTLFFILVRG